MKTLLWIVLFLCHQAFALPSVAFFYGKQVPIAHMCLYDMIVVDPFSDFYPEDCAPNTQAFAYVNVGEVDKFAPYAKKIRPEWVIGENSAWNKNPILDQTQKSWQTFFMRQLIDPLWKKGYHGFFLDTLDSYILAVHDPLAQQKQVDALVSLIVYPQ